MESEVLNEFFGRVRSLNTFKFSQISKESLVCDEIRKITDYFRWFRNASGELNEQNKLELLKLKFVETCLWFCEHYFKNEPMSRSIILDLLTTFSCDNKMAKECVYEHFQNILREFVLSSSDAILFNCSIMLINSLCLDNEHLKLGFLNDFKMIQKIICHWIQYQTDICKVFLDSIFLNSKEFLFVYKQFHEPYKNPIMDLLSTWLDTNENDVSVEVITTIIDNFFINCTIQELTKSVLVIIEKAFMKDKFSSEIKNNLSIFTKLMDLLAYIHWRGDYNGPVNNIHDFYNKSIIIHIIAIMCCNNLEYQNLMRENDIIPVLLECCPYDAKTPFIREWSLMALKNCLEGNQVNQNYVSRIVNIDRTDPELLSILSIST